jgi:hypothetical protein
MDTNSLITEYLEYLEHSCGFAIRTLKVHKRVCNVWDQFLSTKINKVTEATPADIIDYIDFRQQAGKIKNATISVVPTKQCGSIISISYISCLLAAHSEKPGVYKVKQGSIPKPALLCRDYRRGESSALLCGSFLLRLI